MRRTNAKIVGGVLVLAIILVAVAYAAITSTQLNINGTGNATAKQDNFRVEFIGTPTTGGKGTTTATIDSSVKTNGTVTVNGLTAKGDEATATYTVKNQSADLSADLSAEATSSNEEYFEVLCTLEKTTLKAQEETTLKVTVRLLKTPIDETKENLKTDIGVTVTAEPKQPGEENNGGSDTVTSNTKTTGGTYLPKGFRQVSGTTLEKGLTIQDSQGNQYVWVEVPKTKEVYPTAGLEITEFTESEYTAIETDLHTYTNDYRTGTDYNDVYYADNATGWFTDADQYNELKKKLSELQDDIKSLEIEKKEVFKQIEKYKEKIDVAYEIFSPKSAKNEFVKEQIDEFEKHLNHINKQIEKKEIIWNQYTDEVNTIHKCMDELKSVKKKSVEIREEPNSEQNIKKEIDCINISKEDEKGEFVKIDIKQLKNIIYKCENCNAFVLIDANRSKLELETVIEQMKDWVN